LNDVCTLLGSVEPQEIYHLAAPSSVAQSLEQPYETIQYISNSTLNLLESIRKTDSNLRFVLASSSEIFDFSTAPLGESAPVFPRSPYAVGKLHAQWLTNHYRECYGIFASIGILFNHESPLRGPQFVTKKICHGAVQVALGLSSCLEIGNLNAWRDWGYAPEYVDCMWRMLQATSAETYVVASEKKESVRNFILYAFHALGIDLEFLGTSTNEIAVVRSITRREHVTPQVVVGQTVVRVNPTYFRPSDNHSMLGNAAKARVELGWAAQTSLRCLCAKMIEYELARLSAVLS
jgi:GDPmannose 4,6-dehydratase